MANAEKTFRLNANSKVLMLAFGIALGLPAADAAAGPKICPQFLAKYCVVNRDGRIATVWTNPCFAREGGLRILYPGSCKIFHGPTPRCKGTTCF